MAQVLWLLDRFGLPGSYRKIWLHLLIQAEIQPASVVAESLHNVMKRKLLTKYATRKAPTWIPEEQPAICQHIQWLIEKHKPKAVVLASPESLACIGLNPEFATLHNLRGSVYWLNGIPHIVMLPMSAWHSLVSQKEIGAANYGFESQEALAEGRQGSVHEGTGNGSDRIEESTGRGGDVGAGESGRRNLSDGDRGESIDSDLGRLRGPAIRPDVRTAARSLDEESDESDGDGGSGEEEESDGDDSGSDSGRLDSDSGNDGRDVLSDEIDEPDPDDFFYEPVLSPVGRFTLTADVLKLKRILDSGRNANGPREALVLKYR